MFQYLYITKFAYLQAMKGYILTHNAVRPAMISHMMRRALPKLMEKEEIIRPKGNEGMVRVNGWLHVALGWMFMHSERSIC